MSEIADLVFEENSTLLQVLDQLQVPELAGEVTQIDSRLTQLTAQVSQLGLIVDSNQLNNQAQFNAINTALGAQTDQITDLTEKVQGVDESVTNLSRQFVQIQLEFGDLINEVDQYDARIFANTNDIASLRVALLSLTTQVDQNNRETRLLIDQQQVRIDSLQTSVNSFQQRFNVIDSDLLALKGLPGIVTPGIAYTLNNGPTTNPWVWNLTIDGTYGTRIRYGQQYPAVLNGSTAYVTFLDQFGQMSVTSPARNQAVNVGLQRFAYRSTPTGNYTLTTVNVSKYNN
jgi:hypothetical protein